MPDYNPGPFSFSDLPLFDWRDEQRALFQANSPQSELGVNGGAQSQLPGTAAASQLSPVRFWSQQNGTIDYRQTVEGIHIHGLIRTVAITNLQMSAKIPLVYLPSAAALPLVSLAAKRRRYIFEVTIRRQTLVAGSLLMVGLTAQANGTLTLLPTDANVTQSIFAFRSLAAEAGGAWQIAFRNAFGPGALTLVPTGLTSLAFTHFVFDFTENTDGSGGNGGVLKLYAAQGFGGALNLLQQFNSVNFPVLAAGNIPSWVPQVGSEGANDGVNQDQVVSGSGRFRVFESL